MAKPEIEIIYQDNEIIVINKPSGTSVSSDRSGELMLFEKMADQGTVDADKKLLLIHRLDKETSGVMILAKNTNAQRIFSRYFAKKLVQKTYLAFVSGTPAQSQGTINLPIAPMARNSQLMRVTRKGGKKAVTQWKLLADFGMYSLLAVTPLTGRTHQIRVHLQKVGMPLAIDRLYASSKPIFLSEVKTSYKLGKWEDEKPLLDRLSLHAYQLEFKETQEGRPDFFVAGLDKKFAACLKMLTKHNPKGPAAFLEPDIFEKILKGQRI